MANDDQQQQVDDDVYQPNDDDFVSSEVAKVCKVYDKEDFFTVFVQLLLALFALLSLWFKRQNERPRRKFRTWFLDISKQGLGACYAHVCNMVIASVIISNVRGGVSLDDQCAWYGMCYLVDTTLGLVLAVWGLRFIDYLAHTHDWVSLKHSGVYEGVDGILHWVHQVVAWLLNLTWGKVVIYYFMVLFSRPLAWVGGILFSPFHNIRFELLFVMIFFPGFLNVIYFWIADSYLQAQDSNAGAHEVDPAEVEIAQQRKEALLDPAEGESECPLPKTTIV